MAVKSDEKVWVRNLCNWIVCCPRITSVGDIHIVPNGRLSLTAEEVMGQIYNHNVLFCGETGDGSHARIYVESKDIRVEAGFETDTDEQEVVTDDKIKAIFDTKTTSAFKKAVEKSINTEGEKNKIIEVAKKLKINDYERIKYIEEYTGYKFE